MSAAVVSQNSEQSPGYLLCLSIAMFLSYMTIGLPMMVIPLYVHEQLGLNDTLVGIIVGIQFLATVLTRSYAGYRTDQRGARRITIQGQLSCAMSGMACLTAALLPSGVALPFALLLTGRLFLGLGESLVLTGSLTWGMGLAGPQRAGAVMSWNGMATYGALATGAPLGMLLYQKWGLVALGIPTLLLPLLAMLVNQRVPHIAPHGGDRTHISTVIRQIWRPGIVLALQGIGFATLSTFVSLYFSSRQWDSAGFALTAFGCAFIVMRLLFGNFPDRYGGSRVATLSLLLECSGLLLLWAAPDSSLALSGAALTGAGCSLIYPSMGVKVISRVSPQVRGTALGGYSAFQDIAYGVTGPLAGTLATFTGYPTLFLVAAGCALTGAVVVHWLM
ncbi:TPA: arabinose transporter [Salmonella enterica]